MNAGGVSKACKSNGFLCVAIHRAVSGKRERNTLVTCLEDGHNPAKAVLIPDIHGGTKVIPMERSNLPREGPMAHQLVGRVTAYQGDDE